MLNSFKRLAAATLAVSVMTAAAFAQTGVITINTFDDLRKIGTDAGYPLNGSYELSADIDASSSRSQAFAPIGSADGTPFSGTFDGKGHTISGLYINLPDRVGVGLFGVAENAEIKEILFVADSIIGESNVGALIGMARSTTVQSCHTRGYVRGTHIGNSPSVGGLVGATLGATITNSSSNSDCHGSGTVGGLVGYIGYNTVITASYAAGNVTSTVGNAGGLVGYSDGAVISRCYAAGNVSGRTEIGGFIGMTNGDDTRNITSISNCYSTGNVRRDSNSGSAGGFAGMVLSYTTIINCYSTGRVVNGNSGFVGYMPGQSAINNFWDIETSNQSGAGNGGAVGKSTAEMMQQATFTDWDFETVWGISEGNCYPQLRGVMGGYFINLRYVAGTGGRIIGASSQFVERESDGSTVVAVADAGYVFAEWSDGVTDRERTDRNVIADISITANFVRTADIEYTLRYELGTGGGSIIGSPVQTVLPGANGTEVYATAEAGYTFARWSDGSTDNPRIDIDIQDNITVTAHFTDPDGNISVASNDRVIPPAPNAETAVVAPVSVLTGEFAAGPNPAGKSSGVIAFYWQGKRIKSGSLVIYDAAGNIVRTLAVKDDAVVGCQAKRAVGSWDLRDGKGRLVSEGTYLVKGKISAADGKRERVSVVVGVR